MRLICQWILIVFALFASFAIQAENTDSPIGYWKTIDDSTGKPKSIVQIWQNDQEQLMGKVVKIYPKDGVSFNKLCTNCKGEYKDKPIVGMVILSGLKPKENRWDNGKILDPENGKFYSCSVRVSENGNRLKVHGYIALPLLGRSQMWERVDLMSDDARMQP